jgi:hypothetical protein
LANALLGKMGRWTAGGAGAWKVRRVDAAGGGVAGAGLEGPSQWGPMPGMGATAGCELLPMVPGAEASRWVILEKPGRFLTF